MFGNTLLLCGAGKENNGPVISEIKTEYTDSWCDADGLWDQGVTFIWLRIDKLESNYALIQHKYKNQTESQATTANCNIGSCTIKDGYRRIDELAQCGPYGTVLFRMCWADASYKQISDWSDWKSFS